MDKRGILLVVSGFSGAGKGTVVRRLMEKYDNYALSVSATTRTPREGEREGVEYFFKTKEEFEAMIARNALIEHACYVGNYYGTPKSYVDEKLGNGYDVILEIEIQGALQIKHKFPDACLIFISPPDGDTLERRLTGRGTESREDVRERLSRAAQETEAIEGYDYFVINDLLEECVEAVHSITRAEHCRRSRNTELIEAVSADIKRFAI